MDPMSNYDFDFLYESGQIMTKYDLLWTQWVIIFDFRTDSNMT